MNGEAVINDGGENRSTGSFIGPWVQFIAISLCVLAVLAILALFGLRTPFALSHLAAPQIADAAEERGIDLEIGAMNGVGLTGVRLHDVTARIPRGGGVIHFHTDKIDVYPSLSESLSAGHPVVEEVLIGHSSVRIDRHDGADRSPQIDDTLEDSAGLQRWLTDTLAIEIAALTVDMAGLPEPAHFQTLAIDVDVDLLHPVDLRGHGTIADVDFELEFRDDALFADVSSTMLADKLGELPFQVALEGISLARDDLYAFAQTGDIEHLGVGLHGLTAHSPYGGKLTMYADESRLEADDIAVGWQAPQATVAGGQREYELTTLELAYRQDVGGVAFYTEISDGEGGTVALEGQWHLSTSLVGINAWIDDFAWDGTMPWPFGGDRPVREAVVDGAFYGDIDLVHHLASLDGRATLRNLVIDFPPFASGLVSFEEVDMELPITFDVRAGALSVVDGAVTVGDELQPLGFDAQIVEAGGGSHVFHIATNSEDIDAAQLARWLPDEVVGVIGTTSLKGSFGVQVEMAGHSAYPESLVFEVDLDGDVDVVDDQMWANHVAESGEIALFDSEGKTEFTAHGQWRTLDELPPFVPAAVLSAEDTTFFEHDGVDWQGLRLAMVDNIEEGALVRGGSTITQQVAKNLFLTHDRTISRKLQEAFLTWRVEQVLTKEEILELYLNIVEWGPEIHGIDGAARHYFDHSPAQMSPVEAVMLASILPNPIRFGGAIYTGYLPSSREGKMRRVLENMRFLDDLSWDAYHTAIADLDAGRIGNLDIEPCADEDSAPDDARSCSDIEVRTRQGHDLDYEYWERQGVEVDDGWEPVTQ